MSKHAPNLSDTERRVLRVLDYIHDNLTEDLSLDVLADVAAMSRFHWHRVFRAVTGETVAQTVRRMRMNRAGMDLVLSDASIPRIAASIGYPNPASFARVFAEHYGITPSLFRRQGKLRPDSHSRKKGNHPMTTYPVDVRDEPQRRLAAMPHSGAYHHINVAFEKLSGLIGARGLFGQIGQMVGVYYDDPSSVREGDLRSHAAFEMPEGIEIAPPMEQVDLTAGRQAVMTYTGPYTGLQAAYDQFYAGWLPKSGETPADQPTFEIYLNSPLDTAPDKLVTELHMPLV